MYRTTNRASFIGKPGASCLAPAYCKLVAIELTVKDHLGPAASSMKHNLQALLGALAVYHEPPPSNIPKAALISKANQLANLLHQTSCIGTSGLRMPVPSDNYPFMRYVMHEYDGTDPADTKEADLQQINATADDIIQILTATYAVTP